MGDRPPSCRHSVTVVVDLFAGLGGWDHAARQLGLDPLGIEWNADACATREAVGLRTLHADIAALDPADFAPCEGLIASPPCQDFSVAGKGAGRDGERGQLVDEVMRWTDALRPRWVACEQVPPVLPIWREFAHRMEGWGYRCWTGLLSSERYGVPQTRERAILMASLDFTPQPPAPTHQEYRHGEPARREVGLFGDLEPWVSMAEALGWGMTERPAMTQLGDDRGCGASSARAAIRAERDRGAWMLDRRQTGAPVIDTSKALCPTLTGTVGRSEDAIRLTLPEGLTLQGFPPDYPVQGTTTAQWLQVGNAIPPPLAKAILTQLVPAQEADAIAGPTPPRCLP